MNEYLRRVDLVVSIWIDENADVQEVVQEMNYTFDHPAIREHCIEDISGNLICIAAVIFIRIGGKTGIGSPGNIRSINVACGQVYVAVKCCDSIHRYAGSSSICCPYCESFSGIISVITNFFCTNKHHTRNTQFSIRYR